jgi:hypothetical protein
MFLAVTLTENNVLKRIYGEEKASLKQQLQLKRALNDDQKVKLHNFCQKDGLMSFGQNIWPTRCFKL